MRLHTHLQVETEAQAAANDTNVHPLLPFAAVKLQIDEVYEVIRGGPDFVQVSVCNLVFVVMTISVSKLYRRIWKNLSVNICLFHMFALIKQQFKNVCWQNSDCFFLLQRFKISEQKDLNSKAK